MRTKSIVCLVGLVAFLAMAASPAHAATIVIQNNDGPGEGFNDPTPATPVGGNNGTTLGEQRLIAFAAAANRWGSLLESDVEIVVAAEFNPLTCSGTTAVLGSAGSNFIFRDFPGAPFSGTWYHSALADALAGSDRLPGQSDINAQFNSQLDDNPACQLNWWYGIDGSFPYDDPTGLETHFFPVLLHEMAHGLGFANFINESTGQMQGGFPDIYSRFTYDVSTGLHWNEMTTNAQRVASAINTGNVVLDGPETKASADDFLTGNNIDLVVNTGPAAGTYATVGALFGGSYQTADGLTLDMEIVNDGTALPTEGCNTLVGFTPGRIALIDRGTCEFGVKALNAENAGAGGVIIANNIAGSVLMAPGAVGLQVTIPVVAMTLDDANVIRTTLPQNGTFNVIDVNGLHPNGFPLIYTPNPVELGSSVSHFDTTAGPDALMEPAITPYLYNDPDMTLGMYRDEGWVVHVDTPFFFDGFESGDTSVWPNVVGD